MNSPYLIYLAFFIFAAIVILTEDHDQDGGDDDQDGGILQPVYTPGGA